MPFTITSIPSADSSPSGAFRITSVPGMSSAGESSRMALEGIGPLEKLLINYGAGTDSLIKGAKGLFGFGPDDAEIADKRERDRALADNTVGGSIAQLAGEIAPTLAIPGSGFVKGASLLTRGVPVAARLGTAAAIGDAAIGGGLVGALQLTSSDESRLFNSAVGAIGGAAFAGLIAAGKGVKNLITSGGAEGRAASRLVREMGGEDAADAVLAKARAYAPQGVTRDIPMSAAEITQNPALARAEQSARTRFTEDWMPLKVDQAAARWDALKAATANDLPAAKAARSAATDVLRGDALTRAAKADFVSPIEKETARMISGPSGANPAVEKLANYVDSVIGNEKVPVTPDRLYEARKVLLSKLNGKMQIGDELSAAAKSQRRETMQLVGAIDSAIDDASGGVWSKYLSKYADKSGEVDSAQALSLIRGQFEKLNAPQFAGVPAVTSHRLGGAIEKFGQNSYGDKLTAGARAGLQDVQENIAMTDGLQKLLKMTGTGGGSNTAMDLTALAAEEANNKLVGLVPILGKLAKRSEDMTLGAMSDILRNPTAFIGAVSEKLAQRLPLTKSEETLLLLLRSAGAGGSLEVLSP